MKVQSENNNSPESAELANVGKHKSPIKKYSTSKSWQQHFFRNIFFFLEKVIIFNSFLLTN